MIVSVVQDVVEVGIEPLKDFVDGFMRKVYKPYLPNTATILSTGNTDAWNRVVQTLINREPLRE